jgi:hypothetical protein
MDNDITFVEGCIDKAGGGNGLFQKITANWLSVSGFVLPSLFVYAFGFYTLCPVLQCYDPATGLYDVCTQEAACMPGQLYQIDYSDPQTIINFVTILDMVCEPDYSFKVSLFGSIMLCGFMVGSIFLTPWADVIGRKKANQLVSCI